MNFNEKMQGTRDEHNKVRRLNHNQQPVILKAETPQQLAKSYLEEVAKVYEIPLEQLSKVSLKLDDKITNEGASFRFRIEKKIMDTVVVSYIQTYFGLEVWESAFNIIMQKNPLRVLSSSSTAHHDIKVKMPGQEALERTPEKIEAEIREFLAANKMPIECKKLTLNRKRLIIFKYNAANRVLKNEDHKKTESKNVFKHLHPTHPLPPVPKNIIDGQFYVVHEILFTSESDAGKLNWIAMVDVETNTVLYLRALVAGSDAFVFVRDPITTTGNLANSPSATTATLNPLRETVTLQGLVPPTLAGQELEGEFVYVTDSLVPNILPPIEPSPFNFMYDVRTNNFAAANAYYHCDAFFRMLQDMGFVISDYFPGTIFPVPVDHRGSYFKLLEGGTVINAVNAQCQGNASNNGIGLVNFLLAYQEPAYSATEDVPDPPDGTHPGAQGPLGMAADWRVVLHELAGHGTLWNHVNSPNFGFAHSAGDSVAAILNDPGSQAPDRFLSFPWVGAVIDRRHDRAVTAGWGWGGNQGDGGYQSEQILSTTLFRFYQSIGGDSTSLAMKEFAARFAVYLIIKAEGTLTPGSTPNALDFEIALETVDAGIWNSANPAETHAGGAYYKVIRWAFEKQGLFQPASAVFPNNDEGVPPDVDVYINDGRNGEYQYLANHWSCQDIWNRTSLVGGDGGGVHQDPIVDQPNYGYVRIKNRGTQPATNIVVKGFHCNPGVGLTFPTDWAPMTTTQLTAPNLAANDNVGVVVGPFEWTPSQLEHECMFFSVSADGDASNIDGRITGEIPEWRLVPNDNNIAQRNVAPVPGSGGGGLVDAFRDRPFWVHNPFSREAKIVLKPVLPKFLQERGWELHFSTTGGNSFVMQPRVKKEVRMQLRAGKNFNKELVLKNKEDAYITIYAYANDILIGGMTYQLDPELDMPSNGGGVPSRLDKCCTTISILLKIALVIGVLIVVLLFLIWKGH